MEKLEKEKQELLDRLTYINPRPAPPEVKAVVEEAAAEEGDTEMEPGEATATEEGKVER